MEKLKQFLKWLTKWGIGYIGLLAVGSYLWVRETGVMNDVGIFLLGIWVANVGKDVWKNLTE